MTIHEQEAEEALGKWSSSKYAISTQGQINTDLLTLKENVGHKLSSWLVDRHGRDIEEMYEMGVFDKAQPAVLADELSGYSRRPFRRPVATADGYIPSDEGGWIGFERYGGLQGGLIGFHFRDDNTVDCEVYPPGFREGVSFKATDMQDWDPSKRQQYWIVTRKSSVEFWVTNVGDWSRLVGIVQASPVPGRGQYDVRNASPYYVGQIPREMPTPIPALVEGLDGKWKFYFSDGGESAERPRSLEPITDGSRWEGTSIDSGTLTSDGIPCLGFDNLTVYFIADGSGTLDLNVDYGFNAFDEYDSVSTSADSLEEYTFPAETRIPWLQLEFTPDSYPTTITRAIAVMR